MKILVAEDEPILLRTIELRLKKDGYEVVTSIDGREALAKIEEQGPDLIIADIMMPFASGLEIVAAVKKKNSSTPVIILSAMEKESVVLEAFQLGADDYITKPFSLSELSMRVKRFALSFSSRNP
jgi:DNA-binding response OmpR family regulator